MPEDDELLPYLEEFSPCGPDGCEIPQNHFINVSRSGSGYSQQGYGSNSQGGRRPSLDHGLLAARAAAAAAGAATPSGYSNHMRSQYRDSMMPPPQHAIPPTPTNGAGRTSPWMGHRQQRSADPIQGSQPPPYDSPSTAFMNMITASQDVKRHPYHQFAEQQQPQHHQQGYNNPYEQHSQQQQRPYQPDQRSYHPGPTPMIRTNSLASPLMPPLTPPQRATSTRGIAPIPSSRSIHSNASSGVSGYQPRATQSLDIDRRSVRSGGSDSGYSEEDDDPNAILEKYGGNSLTFTESERPTLFELLKPYVPSVEQANAEFSAYQTLNAWLMGGSESAFTHYAHWKPSLRGMQYAVPRMLNVPKIDIGAHAITVKLRRAILLVSSMQYRCHYCAAHAAGIGDVLSGSYRSHVRAKASAISSSGSGNSLPTRFKLRPGNNHLAADEKPSIAIPGNTPTNMKPIMDPSDPRNNQRDADALRLVTAASRIPSKVTPDLKKRVVNSFGVEGMQTIACISAIIGWTNAITDSVGMQLGANDILFASEQIGPSGWSADRHAPDTFNESGRFSSKEMDKAKKEEFVPKRGVKRLLDYNTILKKLHVAEKECVAWTKAIPTSHRALDDWMAQHMGFVPKYVSCLQNLDAKRAVCFMLWLYLVRSKEDPDPCVGDEPCEWSNGAKALMFYVYTTATGNLLLRGHAAYLAIRRKVPIHILVSASAGVPVHNARLDATLDFIRSAASLKRVFTASNNIRLLENMVTPRGAMEAVSSLGLFNMLHRLSAITAPEPVQFEPIVKDFLESFGGALDMDPSDAAPQSKEERKVVDPLQFLF
ncbi:hypothetical protein HDU67_007389 [Dinochytrium kinnereticum]|nr:hypothetical protein HDU67_007389 [Dinochytrium kinnereticum]